MRDFGKFRRYVSVVPPKQRDNEYEIFYKDKTYFLSSNELNFLKMHRLLIPILK